MEIERYGIYWAQLDPVVGAEIAVDQIRTLSRKRIRSKIDHLDSGNAARLRRLISEMYGTGA